MKKLDKFINKLSFAKIALIILPIISICIMINSMILYKVFSPKYNVKPNYDYRIAIFGNNGEFPRDIVDFASNLNNDLQHLSAEQTMLPFKSEGYNVISIALDTNSFSQWFTDSSNNISNCFVLSSLYSTGVNNIDNIPISLGEYSIDITGVSNKEIPLGAINNITIPTSLGPTILLVTTQETANELYKLFPTNQQRQISIYYETSDGEILTKQMESFSPKQMHNIQIWDNQDFSFNSKWTKNTTIKKYLFIICLLTYTIFLESILIFSAVIFKKITKQEDL